MAATTIEIGGGHYAVVELNEDGHAVKWHCPLCNEDAKSKAGLKSHLRANHPGWDEKPPAMSPEELIAAEMGPEEPEKPQVEPEDEASPEVEEEDKKPGETGETLRQRLEEILSMPDEELAAKERRFACNRHPNLSIAIPSGIHRFQAGEFKTDDPELIRAVIKHPWYGIFIFADDPELRLKRR